MKYSIREVLEMALQTEKRGHDFYTVMAEKFGGNAGLKELFGKLALQEKKHEHAFEKLLDSVTEAEPEGWEEAQNYFRVMVESEFFLGREKSLTAMENVKTELETVNLALGFEKESILYYSGLRDFVSDKAAVDDVIKEEKEHVKWLRGLMDTLKA
jgi:rubrerythrin